jgi:prepilin-type N-terminal cleavage/methylation domain-containing protein
MSEEYLLGSKMTRRPQRCATNARRKTSRRWYRETDGFTLAEVLIVILMISVLSAIVLPSLARVTPGELASEGVEELAQAMRLARYRAVAMNRRVYFDFQPSGTPNFYTAYVNLGNPSDVPTGTPAEIDAANIPVLNDTQGSMRGADLPDEVVFATGDASSGPGGAPATSALVLPSNPLIFDPRGTVEWPDGSLATGVIYVSHSEHASRVRAITVARSGMIKVWYFNAGSWE